MDNALLLAAMTVTEFKKFKKAYAILLRAGLNREDAINFLTSRIVNSYNVKYENRPASIAR